MSKLTFLLLLLSTTLSASSQTTPHKAITGLFIDTGIRHEVEQRIGVSEFGGRQMTLLIYNSPMMVDLYEEDSLKASVKEEDKKSTVFKSFYYWRGDTLSIDGAFGLFGGTGFSVKLVNGQAKVYHMLASDNFPTYAFTKNDSLCSRIEVPCTDTKLILSAVPDRIQKQIIYGYVEFKSENYYVIGGFADGKELLPRKKQRANMRIYFKSAVVELE